MKSEIWFDFQLCVWIRKVSFKVDITAMNRPIVILEPSSLLVFVVALVVSLKLPMLSIKSIATSLAVLEK